MKAVKLFPVILLPILLVGGFLLVAHSQAATDSTIVVNTLDDEVNSEGDCSLREAITAANTNAIVDACPAGDDTATDIISFSVSGTITLTSSLPDILTAGPLLIDGDDKITIDGNHEFRILTNSNEVDLTLQNLRISNGNTNQYGGGLSNHGNLTITGSTLSGNGIFTSTLSYNHGGAIYNTGNLTITNSILSDNHISGIQSGYGGSLFNSITGEAYISTSTFARNSISATGKAFGGGLVNAGDLVITSSSIYSNSLTTPLTETYGCGIYNTGSFTITNSTLTDNYSTGVQSGYGGGLYNSITGEGYISTSTFARNSISATGKAFGGGLVNAGDLVITSSSIYSNSVTSPPTETYGGGIYNTGEMLDISNSTISQNSGGVGVYNEIDGLVDIIHSTFAGNDGWGIHNGKFLTITASIVTDECTGSPITDGGNNMEAEDTCDFSSGANTDTLLGPLGDYGGATLTHALLPTSPAIDQADPASCPATDQRGVSRPIDGDGDGNPLCDIGAFEYQPGIDFLPTETTITSDIPDPSYVNQPFTVTTTISSSIGTPTGTVTVTVGGTEAVCSNNLTAGTSSCQLVLTSPGTYTLEAAYSGDSTFAASTASAEHAVIKATSTTTILSDLPDPSMVGEIIVVSFEVTATFGIPTGKVSVYVSDSPETCSNKLANGAGSCELPISKSGQHTLTVSYNGNTALNPSSDTEEHTVDSPEPPTDPYKLLLLPLVTSDN